MWGLHHRIRQLLIAPSCPICRRLCDAEPFPCAECCSKYDLGPTCRSGLKPLRWRALGLYDSHFRHLLLRLKHPGPQQRILPALMALFREQLALNGDVSLVPIPSWKRRMSQRNPLPELIATGLQRPVRHLLVRTRASLSQHHLDRKLRAQNMQNAFTVLEQPSGQPIWLVDDILTTGATAMAARDALLHRGHGVSGLLCLGRTPLNRR